MDNIELDGKKRNDMVTRIKNLLALSAKNDNEHQAARAAEKATELLLKYNIDLAEVRAANNEKPEYIWKQQSVAGTIWKRALLVQITKYNLCKGILSADFKHVHIVGEKQNVEVALYLYVYLRREIERLANEHLPEDYVTYYSPKYKTRWINSFCAGAVEIVVERLRAAYEATSNAGRALMVVNETALSEEVKTRFGETTKFNGVNTRKYNSALAAGRSAGASIPINLGLRGSGNRRQIS